MLDSWRADLRQGMRALRRSPLTTLVALATLAAGIGANTALFTVLDSVVLRALPYVQPERLLFLPRIGDREADVSAPDVADLRRDLDGIEEIAMVMPYWALDLTGSGEPERVVAAVVEPELFTVLRLEPLRGRLLAPGDNAAGAPAVAVLNRRFWRQRFASDPEIVGRALTLSDRPVTVVGVVSEEADVLDTGVDLWMTVAVATPWALSSRGTNNFELLGRLAPGVTVAEASEEVEALSRALAQEYPNTNQGKILHAVSLQDFLVGRTRESLVLLALAVGAVLLIASVNVAGMLLVRAASRDGEAALRLALGGGRAAVVRSLAAECGLLVAAGGAAGVALGVAGVPLLLEMAPAGLPRADSIAADWRVLLFGVALVLLSGAIAIGAPAARIVRSDPASLLGRSGSGRLGRGRALGGVVVVEVMLAFVLLVACGLLVRSFVSLRAQELGFVPEAVSTANLVLPESRYADAEAQTRAFERIVEALEQSPAIEHAAMVIGAPLSTFGQIGHRVAFDDRPPPLPGEAPSARNRPIVGPYFATLGIRMLRGRPFDARDRAGSPPVAIVNRRFAELYWPGQDPIGRRLAWDGIGGEPVWRTVVGVAEDVRTTSLASGDDRAVYIPYSQREIGWARFGTLVLRSQLAAGELAQTVRSAVWSVDPLVPIDSVASMDELVSAATARERFQVRLLLLFAGAALALAVYGIYAVLSYVVAGMRSEIGLRMALGASRAAVQRETVGHGLRWALLGLALGGLLALGLGRFAGGLLFGVGPTDPLTWVLASGSLLWASVLAAWWPSRRAANVDPARSLRAG